MPDVSALGVVETSVEHALSFVVPGSAVTKGGGVKLMENASMEQ